MSEEAAPPLYVDLDGTLIAGDSLWISLAGLARQRPASLLLLPFWLSRGRAALKEAFAARFVPDAAHLPYRPEVVRFVAQERAHGRRVVLATAAHSAIAHAVADHLGLFDRVIASDSGVNRKGREKLRAIETDAGGPFSYVGDGPADLPIWRAAGEALLATGRPRLEERLRSVGLPVRVVSASIG